MKDFLALIGAVSIVASIAIGVVLYVEKDDPFLKTNPDSHELFRPSYNQVKDAQLNEILDGKPQLTEYWDGRDVDAHERLSLYYDTVLIKVIHTPAVKFKSGDEWDYRIIKPNGKQLWTICPDCGTIDYHLSSATYTRLQNLLIQNRK